MNDPQIMQMFSDVGAIVTGSHFVYTSGRHSSVYINKDALYLHTGTISSLCKRMVKRFRPGKIVVVVGRYWGVLCFRSGPLIISTSVGRAGKRLLSMLK